MGSDWVACTQGKRRRRLFPVFIVGLFLTCGVCVGCGGHEPRSGKPRGDVTVTVTYGGTPVTEGSVDLANGQTGEGGGGALDPTGTAKIPHVVQGDYTVTVLPPAEDGIPLEPGQSPRKIKKYPNIPQKFRQENTSPLKAVVKEGLSKYTFDLKK